METMIVFTLCWGCLTILENFCNNKFLTIASNKSFLAHVMTLG